MTIKDLCGVLAALFVTTGAHANPLNHGDLLTLPTRSGVTQSIFLESPSANPRWVVVLFPGVPGVLHLDASGATTLKGNFVVRSASYWTSSGDAAALVDTPSDKSQGVDDVFRLSAESFADTQAIVASLRRRFPHSKIALVGTSAGTVSVGNALQRNPALVDAFVLTSPVTRGSATVADVNVDGTKHRVLVVSNEHDECVSSPAYAGKRLAEHNHFSFVQVSSTDGSGNASARCAGHSPHGFFGIETQVLSNINDWLNGKSDATLQ